MKFVTPTKLKKTFMEFGFKKANLATLAKLHSHQGGTREP
jgi:hypothetical protein